MRVGFLEFLFVLWWVGGDVGEGSLDGFWYWWSYWQMGTFWVVTEFISGVFQFVGLAIISLVDETALGDDSCVILVDDFQFSVLLGFDSMAGFEAGQIKLSAKTNEIAMKILPVVEFTVVVDGGVVGNDRNRLLDSWRSSGHGYQTENDGDFHFCSLDFR